MRFGLDIAQHQLTWDELLDRARLAEEAGLEGVWVFDHLKALYGDPKGPSLEAWTPLAGLARETSRVRLGTLVTGMTHRHPTVLAAGVLTIDHVSGERVECAVGAAWNQQEHRESRHPVPVDGRAHGSHGVHYQRPRAPRISLAGLSSTPIARALTPAVFSRSARSANSRVA